MAGEDINSEVLKYLKKEGPTNTFRLTRMMGLERNKLLTIIGKLEEKEAVKCERGNVLFLKFPVVEKPVKVVAPLPEQQKIKKAIARKPAQPKALLLLQAENKQLQQKVVQLGETMKELEQKASAAPKTITKTVTKTIVKKVPVTKTIIKKIHSRPKIVTKIVTKRVPAAKTSIKKIPFFHPLFAREFSGKAWQKLREQSQKFKMPVKISGATLLKNLRQLNRPEFA